MKVSIITVCYNSSATIEATINSVLSQSYNNIEYIVIDGKSTDKTLEIVKRFSGITKLISEPDEGLYYAMNKGIQIAEGDIIGILNSDDVFYDNQIVEKVVNHYNKMNCDIVYGNIQFVNNKNDLIRVWKSKKFIKNSFLKGWHPPHPSLFVKSAVYRNYGVFDTQFKIAADFDLMLRFFEKYCLSNSYLNITFVSMLVGGASNSIGGILRGNREIRLSFKKNILKPSRFYIFYRYLPKIFEILRK